MALMTVRTRAIDLRRSCLYSQPVSILSPSSPSQLSPSKTLVEQTYILLSFEDAPPAIFWTRSWPSSVFSSSSCFFKSSLPLLHSWPGLTLALVDYTQALVFHGAHDFRIATGVPSWLVLRPCRRQTWWVVEKRSRIAKSMPLDDETNFRNVWNECQELLFRT